MAKTLVSVASSAELTSVFVSECEDGCLGWSAADRKYFSLNKNFPSGGVVPPGSVVPADGSPIAGNAAALWVKLSIP